MIRNAIQLVVLAGQSDQIKREREEVLEVIDNTNYIHYVILFKNAAGRYDVRALYAAAAGEQSPPVLQKIYGPTSTLAPEVVEDSHIEKFFKYSSG
jgi:hypothetical protein